MGFEKETGGKKQQKNLRLPLSLFYLIHKVVLEAELVEQLGAADMRGQGRVGDDDGLCVFVCGFFLKKREREREREEVEQDSKKRLREQERGETRRSSKKKEKEKQKKKTGKLFTHVELHHTELEHGSKLVGPARDDPVEVLFPELGEDADQACWN